MRTLTKTLIAFAVIGFLTSCGGEKKAEAGKEEESEICTCVSANLSMTKDMIASGRDANEDKIKEIENKYEAKMEKCRKLAEGKSQEELNKMEEEVKKCPSYKEMEKLQKEMMGGK
jgi:hypothetical protein